MSNLLLLILISSTLPEVSPKDEDISEFIEDMQLIDRGDFIKLEENHMIIDIMNKEVEDIFMPTL